MSNRLFAQIFMGSAQRTLFPTGVPVLTYHSIGQPPRGAQDPFLYVASEQFERQLSLLRKEGYETVSLSNIVSETRPGKNIVITFDDGCQNVFLNAMEPMSRHGVTGIQFLVAKLIGQKNEWMVQSGDAPELLMDKSQVKEWLARGHEIGSHTLTHTNLRKLSRAEAAEEISGSKKKLEDTFGVPVRHFAYPFGKWNEAARDLVIEAGYETACTTAFGVNTPATDPYTLSRIVPLSRTALFGKIAHRLLRRPRKAAANIFKKI